MNLSELGGQLTFRVERFTHCQESLLRVRIHLEPVLPNFHIACNNVVFDNGSLDDQYCKKLLNGKQQLTDSKSTFAK